MNNADIIYKTKHLIENHKKPLFTVMIFINLLTVISTFIEGEILPVLLSILLLPIGQASIRIAKRVYYNDNVDSLNVYDDGLMVFKSWFKYIKTYLLYAFVLFLIMAGVAIIVSVIMYLSLGSFMDSLSIFINNGGEITGEIIALIGIFALIVVLVSAPIEIWFASTYFASFYILEDNIDMKVSQILKKSRKLMKGKKIRLIKLCLSFLPVAFVCFVLQVLMNVVLDMLVFTNLALMLSTIFGVVIMVIAYRLNFDVSLYIFYKEVVLGDDHLVFDEVETSKVDDNVVFVQNGEVIINEETFTADDDGFVDGFTNKILKKGIFIYIPLYFLIISAIVSYVFFVFINSFNITDENFINVYFNFASNFATLVAAVLIFKPVLKPAWKYFVAFKNKLKFTISSYLVIYGVLLISNIIVQLIDSGSESTNQASIELMFKSHALPMFIIVVFFAPIIEEFVFRGVIFRAIRKINRPLAIIISSFLFGFIHVSTAVFAGDYMQMIQVIPYFAMGLVLVLYYEKYKNIAVPIYLHMINNFVSVILIVVSMLF